MSIVAEGPIINHLLLGSNAPVSYIQAEECWSVVHDLNNRPKKFRHVQPSYILGEECTCRIHLTGIGAIHIRILHTPQILYYSSHTAQYRYIWPQTKVYVPILLRTRYFVRYTYFSTPRTGCHPYYTPPQAVSFLAFFSW